MTKKQDHKKIEKKNKAPMTDKQWDKFLTSKEYNGSEKYGTGDKDVKIPKKKGNV